MTTAVWPARPVVYEINTAVWLHELSQAAGRVVTLGDVAPSDWDAAVPAGTEAVWLMGVWERSPAGLAVATANAELQESFRQALPDLMAGVSTAANQPGVSVVAMSWGFNEFPGETQYDSNFTTPGITYIAASGDSPGAEYPAASPDVLSVGGTSLYLNASGNQVTGAALDGQTFKGYIVTDGPYAAPSNAFPFQLRGIPTKDANGNWTLRY